MPLGARHYWVSPDQTDPNTPSTYNLWPWKEMDPGDYLLLLDGSHDHLFNSATVSAYRYAKRHGKEFRSGRFRDGDVSGIMIWRR